MLCSLGRLKNRTALSAQCVRRICSREREVRSACAALAESVQSGDTAWFERVLQQLRGVLLERQSEAAAQQVAAPAEKASVRTSFPTAQAPVTAPATAPMTPVAPAAPRKGPSVEEPPWLQALRLLEAAAKPKPNSGPAQHSPASTAAAAASFASPSAASAVSSATPAVGYFPALEQPQEEADLQAYLDSFVTDGGGVEEEDPKWAKAIRILESVPLGRDLGRFGSPMPGPGSQPKAAPRPPSTVTGKEPSTSPSTSSSAFANAAVDRGRKVRMQSYQAMLQQSAQAAPGASVPVRFSSSPKPKAAAKVPAPAPSEAAAPSEVAAPKVAAPKAKAEAKRASDVGVGRGHLVPAVPTLGTEVDDGELRKEDFVWSEHEFNDGDKENRRVLRKFTKEFKQMAEEIPDGIKNPRLLTAALDLALACVKCYELDKADAIYRRVLGECRRRGMPWDVKCLQDLATLRCKQHRQADAAELLEELAAMAPPHPATFINLGTVYNQLRQFEKAESWFHQAVNLKGGVPEREDIWNLGICKKNMGLYSEALPMLQQALAEFQEHEPHHPVTIAKLHSSLGGCLHEMARFAEAVEQYQQAYDLYVATVGRRSPLFCGAAEGLAKALQNERRFSEAFQALLEAFEVHARCDSVHPTPLFECLEMALAIHEQCPTVRLLDFRPLIEDGLQNLGSRGQDSDGNAGLVMARAGKLLARATETEGISEADLAARWLRRGRALIAEAQETEGVDLAHEVLQADLLLRKLEAGASNPSAPRPAVSPQM